MAARKTNIIAVASASPFVDAMMRNVDAEKISVQIKKSRDEIFKEASCGRMHALLLSTGAEGMDIENLSNEVLSNPATSHTPIFVIDEYHEIASAPAYADGVIAYAPGESDAAATAPHLARIFRGIDAVYHPVTRLLTGGPLMETLSGITHDVKKSGFFLLVKLMGMKAFNMHKNYDAGDNLMAAFAEILYEILSASENHSDVLGHLHSDEFCIFTYEKRVETMCKNILVKSERLLRSFYSPYELMRGYITIEGDKQHGHYFLAETMITGAEVPLHWDSHYVYVTDLLKELMKKVEADDLGYRIMKL